VIVLPWLGVLVYLIARGRSMSERDAAAAEAREDAFRSSVQEAARTTGGTTEELGKLADLRASGVITESEFAQQKAKILA
jgi:hypothetical protein